jgi:hypothetical protein
VTAKLLWDVGPRSMNLHPPPHPKGVFDEQVCGGACEAELLEALKTIGRDPRTGGPTEPEKMVPSRTDSHEPRRLARGEPA